MILETGKKVRLKDKVKEELIFKYKSSNGLSGLNPVHADSEFTIKYLDGNNFGVETSKGEVYSFHYSRFKLNKGRN